METWLGNIGLNSGKFSFKVMIFIPTSECSHILGVTGRSVGIQKTLEASKTTDDAMGLKGNEGKTTYTLKKIIIVDYT
jgi:hypothetical protein